MPLIAFSMVGLTRVLFRNLRLRLVVFEVRMWLVIE